MSDKDVDAQFADIVAHWDEVAMPPERRLDEYAAEPAPEDAGSSSADAAASAGTAETTETTETAETAESATGPETAGSGTQSGSERRPGVNPPPELGFVVWRGATGPVSGHADAPEAPHELDAEDEDDHFVPGPTAPLPPQEDLHFWGIIVGLVAGPLLLLWLVIFRPAVSGWWTVGALALTVGGFVLLVMRQPSGSDDDPDDGARI
jgi:hypothetical protein